MRRQLRRRFVELLVRSRRRGRAMTSRLLGRVSPRQCCRQRRACKRQNDDQKTESLHGPPTQVEVIRSYARRGSTGFPSVTKRATSDARFVMTPTAAAERWYALPRPSWSVCPRRVVAPAPREPRKPRDGCGRHEVQAVGGCDFGVEPRTASSNAGPYHKWTMVLGPAGDS